MSESVFTVRINDKAKKKLDAVARKFDRSRNYLVAQAIDYFLDLQLWQVAQTKLASTEADAGDFATGEEIERLNSRYQPA